MSNPDPADSVDPAEQAQPASEQATPRRPRDGKQPQATPGRAASRPLSPDERAALARLDSDQPLTDADIAALNRLDDGPDDPDPDPDDIDLDCAPPEWWLAMSGEEKAWLDDPEPAPAQPEVLDAGFIHLGGSGGIGFAAGGLLDRMDACEALAVCAGRVWDAGLGRLSDYELAGLIRAARRLTSRQAALELAAVAELAARRAAPDGAPGEHLEDEVAALLTLTGWTAAKRIALAEAMTRMPAVAEALAAGRIDADKAGVFADELIVVDDDEAAARIAAGLVPAAPGLTTGELRRKLRQEIGKFDPDAAKRRKDKAHKNARVDVWIDADGTGAIAARGMDPAAAIAADQNLDADARWLQDHGADATLDQLRVAAAAARLASQPLTTLLPHPADDGTAGNSAAGPSAGSDDNGTAHNGTADTREPGNSPRPPASAANTPGGQGATPHDPGLGSGLSGTVNLTIPAGTWLGTSDNPGESDRYGVLDAGTCRDLATTLARHPATRWCVTLVDPTGRAVGHGCARAGPGPPGTDRAAWLATVQITPIETGTCAHRRESAGYRPSPGLRHIIKIRSPRCGFPGCRRRAVRCDDDHTIPHHNGGKTCECNLYPLCRRHHQTKQAQGWHVTQPEPGVLIWTLPCGRQVTVTPEPYLT
jgi:hypothetical protein